MTLQPRKFIWKNKQKNRKRRIFKESLLSYGLSGVRLLQPYRTTAKKIFRFKIFLKKSSRKPDLTRRSLWINLFPHLPLTKKPKGMRMGKGAGKLATWYTHVHGGIFLIEFSNLRVGRAEHYAVQVQHKLPVQTKFTTFFSKTIKIHGGQKTNPSHWEFY